jgi:aminopeptidase N
MVRSIVLKFRVMFLKKKYRGYL